MHVLTIKNLKAYNIRFWISYLLIRCKVYLGEFKRGFFEEFDNEDITAKHFVFLKSKRAIGIARVIYKEDTAQLGRIAITKECRNRGYGKEYINQLLNEIKINGKAKIVSLYAANHDLIKFYKQLGFTENGEAYFENIPYVNMIKAF